MKFLKKIFQKFLANITPKEEEMTDEKFHYLERKVYRGKMPSLREGFSP